MSVNNLTAILAFLSVIGLSLVLVLRAYGRNRSAGDYYTAGGGISAGRNGLALAGDFISAGGFLGLTGLIALNGADAAVYAVGVLFAWPLMLVLFAGPLKRLGRYTLADVVTSRLGSERLRLLTAGNQIVILLLGLTSNLVGAMLILRLLFGLSPLWALSAIALVMLAYTILGGMLAATWLQVIKALLLMAATALILTLSLERFDFELPALMHAVAAVAGDKVLRPGTLYKDGWETLSLLMGLALGGASMPHVLMRMNTVRDARAASRSAFIATGIVVAFHLMIVLVGFAAMVLLTGGVAMTGDRGANMVMPRLAAMLGGQALFGGVSAIAFMTMLAVMAGQCIAGAAALSHDIWAQGWRRGRDAGNPLRNGQLAALLLLTCGLVLAFLFREQNIGFIAAMSMAIAASANFPVLMLAIFWQRLTAAGAAAGMLTGLCLSVTIIALSPLVQVGVLGRAEAVWSLQYPGIISIPSAFAAAILVSLAGRGPLRAPVPGAGRLSLLLGGATLLVLGSFAVGTVAAAGPLGAIMGWGGSPYLLLLAGMALAAYAIASLYVWLADR